MKKIISLALTLSILLSLFSGLEMSVFASSSTTSITILEDIEEHMIGSSFAVSASYYSDTYSHNAETITYDIVGNTEGLIVDGGLSCLGSKEKDGIISLPLQAVKIGEYTVVLNGPDGATDSIKIIVSDKPYDVYLAENILERDKFLSSTDTIMQLSDYGWMESNEVRLYFNDMSVQQYVETMLIRILIGKVIDEKNIYESYAEAASLVTKCMSGIQSIHSSVTEETTFDTINDIEIKNQIKTYINDMYEFDVFDTLSTTINGATTIAKAVKQASYYRVISDVLSAEEISKMFSATVSTIYSSDYENTLILAFNNVIEIITNTDLKISEHFANTAISYGVDSLKSLTLDIAKALALNSLNAVAPGLGTVLSAGMTVYEICKAIDDLCRSKLEAVQINLSALSMFCETFKHAVESHSYNPKENANIIVENYKYLLSANRIAVEIQQENLDILSDNLLKSVTVQPAFSLQQLLKNIDILGGNTDSLYSTYLITERYPVVIDTLTSIVNNEYDYIKTVTEDYLYYSYGMDLFKYTADLWEIETKYVVTLDANFDDSSFSNKQYFYFSKGETLDERTRPHLRSGYEFVGWYTDKECTIEYNFDNAIENNFTLYAKWEKKFNYVENEDGTATVTSINSRQSRNYSTMQLFSLTRIVEKPTQTALEQIQAADSIVPLFIDGKAIVSIAANAVQSNCSSIYIPEIVENIENDAIGKSTSILCWPNSYAHRYAESNGYEFSLLSFDETEENKYETFTYAVNDDEQSVTITGLVERYKPSNLSIPSTIKGYPVTRIADFAFLKNAYIKSVTIPSTITTIGNYAFYKCSALTQIKFSQGLETIGDGAFGSCTALTSALLPYTVADLGLSAFENCSSLVTIQLSDNITELKDRTFYNCDSLETFTIPDAITNFGKGIFGGCNSLKSVYIRENYPSINLMSNNFLNIHTATVAYGVEIIDNMCFYGTDLYSVTIPDSIKTIGGYVGDYSDLNHIFYEGTESSWSSLMRKASQYGSTQKLSKIKDAGHIHFEVSLQNNTTIKDEVAPTCTEDGSNNIYCNICNELLGSEIIPATGHVGKLVQKVLPTCTEQGYSKYYCVVCDEEYITEYVNATNQHNYDENGSCYFCDHNIYFDYLISNEEVTITGYLTDKSTITVPSRIEFLPVKHIANNAFEGCTVIENIELSDSITSIGEKAFSDCTSIANIDIPDSVISIGEYAFSNCSNLETITVGSAVTSIGNYCFADCTNVVQINYNATDASENINEDSYNLFENAGTSGEGIKVFVGNNVKTIPENLFWSYMGYADDFRYVPPKITNATIGRNVEIIGDGAFARCSDLTNVTFSGNKLTTIEDEAFSGCNFTSLSFPKSLKSIGWLSFARCPIESIVIPGEMRNIGDSAFYWCEELSNVVIEDGATVVGGFEGCTSIKQIRIPDSVATINSGAFYGCSSLEEIDFGNGVTTISKNAFYGCSSIQNLNLPNELVYIGKSAFANCDGLTKVIIPNKVESIEEYAFEGCSSLKEIELGNSVKNIGKSAFYTCWSLNAAFIPKSMANIGDGAFDSHSFWHVFYEGNAEDWSAITIGNSNDEFINATRHYNVTEYDITYSVEDEPTCLGGGSASYNCSICNDKHYLILSQLEHQGELSCSVPQSCSSEGYDLYICSYCGQEYRLNVVEPLEHELSLINTINGGCTIGSINVYQCLNCNDYCYIPDSVATKEHVFQNGSCVDCHVQEGWEYSIAPSKDGIIVTKYTGSNEEVVIPDSFFGIPVISIGARAFQDCSVIKSIIVPNSVVSLEGYVFMNCSQLETVTLGNNVTSVGYSAFENCSSLENIYIPSSITSIKGGAFSNCESLNNVYITDIEKWCKIKFEYPNSSPMYYAKNLYVNDELITDLIIPDGITYLPHYAFSCENIKTVTVPDSVLSMGQGVFENCSNLESVYITDITSWCRIDYNASRSPLYYADKLYVNGELIADLIIPDGIIKIPSYAFSCQNIKNVVIPESVTIIGDYAFYGCSNLTFAVVPDTVTDIGWLAFENCSWDLKIYCYEGTTAEDYAVKNYIDFVHLAKFTNTENSIIILTGADSDIEVERITDTSTINEINKILNNGEIHALYDIILKRDSTEVQPNNSVVVKILTDNENSKVYRKEMNGSLTDMKAIYMDGYMVFVTNQFSLYALVVEEDMTKVVLGDANEDSKVNIKDATAIQKHIANLVSLTEKGITLADTTLDTKVNIKDATAIQKHIAGIETGFPVGEPLVSKENN